MSNKLEIESITPREHVQLRPYVYAGDCSDATQLLIEILGNSIDEFNIGYGNEIIVKIDNDSHIYVVQDSGRGFPINELRFDNETTLQASFDVLNTSGKFREDGSYSGVSIGKNGQGGKITNFLSQKMDVISWRKNCSEHVWFKNGIFVKRKLDNKTPNNTSGTIITFSPSEKYFTSPTVNLNKIETFCDDITCLCSGLKIILNNKEYYHKNGISDMLDKNIGNSISILSRNIYNEFEEGKQKMSFGMTYISSSSSKIISYVNCGHTLSGPNFTTIKSGITRVLNSWARENKLLKEKDKNLDGNSLQEGLVFVSNITAENVEYDAQIKTTITKIDTSFISRFTQYLSVWLDNNPDDAKAIIEKALIARKASEAAKKAREAVKNKSNKKIKFAAMPSKLADCHNKDRSKCEIYLTEGDSASGGAKIIRDASFQAVMGLKGKILNALTGSAKQIAQNAEIMDILKALGFDYNITAEKVEVDYNPKKLRYGKFIIAADRDPDGDHIQTLILTLLWKLIPQMIIDGYVYIAQPPLYKAEWGTKYKYLEDKKALNKFAESHSNFTLSYYKGLGEASPEELGAMIMNPKTRNIQQVSVEDINLTSETIKALMGSDSKPKKAFVFGNEIKDIL